MGTLFIKVILLLQQILSHVYIPRNRIVHTELYIVHTVQRTCITLYMGGIEWTCSCFTNDCDSAAVTGAVCGCGLSRSYVGRLCVGVSTYVYVPYCRLLLKD